MIFSNFYNLTPSQRCRWIDLIRGLAVIFMIEAHCINVWLRHDLINHNINFFNGLIAPSFIMCSGYSQAISIFDLNNKIRPFYPISKRICIILLCGYFLHTPALIFKKWSISVNLQDCLELFKIDVLQCIGFSILILYGLAKITKKPIIYAAMSLLAAIVTSVIAPYLWQPNVADGIWMPIRGLINGNPDRGVTALFPLVPWFAFAAFGAALGIFYRQMRIITIDNKTRWSELKWLMVLMLIGIMLYIWGNTYVEKWLIYKLWSKYECWRLYNTTLPSIAQRIGIVCITGSLLGIIDSIYQKNIPGSNIIKIASKESLIIYLVHLKLIFGILLIEPIVNYTHWYWHSLDWYTLIPITIFIITTSVMAGVYWQKWCSNKFFNYKVKRVIIASLMIWIFTMTLVSCEFLIKKIKKNKLKFISPILIEK